MRILSPHSAHQARSAGADRHLTKIYRGHTGGDVPGDHYESTDIDELRAGVVELIERTFTNEEPAVFEGNTTI